jgi:hypothetical protein
MKRLLIILVLFTCVITCSACKRIELSELPISRGCTAVYATDGEQALSGANIDYGNPFPRIWFIPGENGDYGRYYVGFHEFMMGGGMNDQGLFYGGSGNLSVHVPRGDKETVGLGLVDRIMRECGTVDCVIEYFDTYHLADVWSFHFLFGDVHGKSVIIDPFTVIRMEGNYQVATNFYQSTDDSESAGCKRYPKAAEMLENTTDLSVEFIRDVMDAVNVYDTVYTTVNDLNGQVVYLYHFHDYKNVVVLNLSEELAQGAHAYDIASLFPENYKWEHWTKPKIDRTALRIESNIDSSISPKIYDAYTGTYLMPDNNRLGVESVSVVAGGNSLWLTFPVGIQFEYFPKSETSFFHIGDSLYITGELNFVIGEDGKAKQFEIDDIVLGDIVFTCERQSDDIFHDLIPILPVETPISKVEGDLVELANDDTAPKDVTTLLPVEKPADEVEDILVKSANDEDEAPNLLGIVLVAGSVILLGGGLAIFLRSRKS